MMLDKDHLMILINLGVCFAGGFVTICRMGLMKKSETKFSVRLIYAIYFVMFVTSGISYWHGEPPTFTQIVMGMMVVAILLIGFGSWANGPPAHTFKTPYRMWEEFKASATGQHAAYRGVERRQ